MHTYMCLWSTHRVFVTWHFGHRASWSQNMPLVVTSNTPCVVVMVPSSCTGCVRAHTHTHTHTHTGIQSVAHGAAPARLLPLPLDVDRTSVIDSQQQEGGGGGRRNDLWGWDPDTLTLTDSFSQYIARDQRSDLLTPLAF